MRDLTYAVRTNCRAFAALVLVVVLRFSADACYYTASFVGNYSTGVKNTVVFVMKVVDIAASSIPENLECDTVFFQAHARLRTASELRTCSPLGVLAGYCPERPLVPSEFGMTDQLGVTGRLRDPSDDRNRWRQRVPDHHLGYLAFT